MEHAASPSLISLGLTADTPSEGSSFRWGLVSSCALHVLIIAMAMFIRFQSPSEQPLRFIDVSLISLPAIPTTAPSSKSVSPPTKKNAVTQPSQKIVSPPPAPTASPVEDALPPLPTESALERLSESLGGAINSIVVPQKRETTSTSIPSQEPNVQPSEDQSSLFENLQLPSAPPTIARPKPLQRVEPLRIPSTPAPPLTPVQNSPQAPSKPPSQQSSRPTPKVLPAVKPMPAIPSLSEVTSFKKSLPRTPPLKTQPAPNLEESLKRSLPDMQTPAPVRRVPKVSRERSKTQAGRKSSIPQVSAPPLLKIPKSSQQTPAMPPPLQLTPAMPSPPKMTETVKKLMESLKLTTRTPMPKPVPLQQTKPSPKAFPSIKPPPSEIDKRIAKLSIPEVSPVESIKQRLQLLEVQATASAGRSGAKPSPGKIRYLAMVEDRIADKWVARQLLANPPLVVLKFRISRLGEISRLQIIESSGNSRYDSWVQRAVQAVNPLPSFPADISDSFFDVKFRFIKD